VSRLLPILLAAWFVCALTPSVSRAQSRAGSEAEPAAYREAINSALEEIQLGNFTEAREQFARAHALFPNARSLRGLGISEFELKHYAVAVDHLSAALASDVRPLEGKLRHDTETLLERANSYTGELRLSVSPKTATFILDGGGERPLSDRLRLDVGDHALEFRAPEYASVQRHVTVRGGQVENIEIQLSRPDAVGKSEQSGPLSGAPAQEERTPVYKRWWLWTIVGAVVVGGVVATVLVVRANEDSTYHGISTTNTPPGAGLQPLWVY
jgi:hypothetical protein